MALYKFCIFFVSYNTRPGNEVGLFYNAPEPTRGHIRAEMFGISKLESVSYCCGTVSLVLYV